MHQSRKQLVKLFNGLLLMPGGIIVDRKSEFTPLFLSLPSVFLLLTFHRNPISAIMFMHFFIGVTF